MAGTADYRPDEGAGWRDFAYALDWLPVPCLMLTNDGTALAANDALAALTSTPQTLLLGDGWLDAVEPADRQSDKAMLYGRAASEGRGSFDCRILAANEPTRSRWQWRSCPYDGLVACAIIRDGDCPQDKPAAIDQADYADALGLVMHRIFGIGLDLQSLISRADEAMAGRLNQVVVELDLIIRDARTAAFRALDS
jgi:hypothetical protein